MALRSDGGVLGGRAAIVLIRRSSFIATGQEEVGGLGSLSEPLI